MRILVWKGTRAMSTVKMREWAAEYRRINEWEKEERLARLSRETIEESVRSYFALCQMLLALSADVEDSIGLWERRLTHYETLAQKWKLLARKQQHV